MKNSTLTLMGPPSLEHLVIFLNWLRQPPIQPSCLSARDAWKVDSLISSWLVLINRAVEQKKWDELKETCNRAIRIEEGIETLPTRKPAAWLVPHVLLPRNKYARGFTSMVADFITYHLSRTDKARWQKIRICRCECYFLQTHRKRYCSDKCRNAANRKPYDRIKDGERHRVYQRAKYLAERKNLPQAEILADLHRRYGEIIQRRNFPIETWSPFKEESYS